MIRQEISNLTFRLFNNIEEAKRNALILIGNSNLDDIPFYKHKKSGGVFYVCNDKIYDNDGMVLNQRQDHSVVLGNILDNFIKVSV